MPITDLYGKATTTKQVEIQAKLPDSQSEKVQLLSSIKNRRFFFYIIHPTAEENQLVHYQDNIIAFRPPTPLNKTRVSKQAREQSEARPGITT